jgi:hypothetical protein
MQIIITTIEGTFAVPAERQADLIHWLKNNANKLGESTVGEQRSQPYVNTNQYLGRQLITEQEDLA